MPVQTDGMLHFLVIDPIHIPLSNVRSTTVITQPKSPLIVQTGTSLCFSYGWD